METSSAEIEATIRDLESNLNELKELLLLAPDEQDLKQCVQDLEELVAMHHEHLIEATKRELEAADTIKVNQSDLTEGLALVSQEDGENEQENDSFVGDTSPKADEKEAGTEEEEDVGEIKEIDSYDANKETSGSPWDAYSVMGSSDTLNDPNVNFAEWEKHTRGIGSRLLAKMGYKQGEGLGKSKEGIINPIEVRLIKQGVSLDYISTNGKKVKPPKPKPEPKPDGFFDFLNSSLNTTSNTRVSLSPLVSSLSSSSSSSTRPAFSNASNVSSRNDKHQNKNVALFNLERELAIVEKELVKARQSLTRNEGKDPAMASRFRAKVRALEANCEELRRRERELGDGLKKERGRRQMLKF